MLLLLSLVLGAKTCADDPSKEMTSHIVQANPVQGDEFAICKSAETRTLHMLLSSSPQTPQTGASPELPSKSDISRAIPNSHILKTPLQNHKLPARAPALRHPWHARIRELMGVRIARLEEVREGPGEVEEGEGGGALDA